MQNYHTHSCYSNRYTPFKDSAAFKEDYAKRAVEYGHRVLTSVEHGFAGNPMRVWETAQKYGLKFVFGIEAYFVADRTQKDDRRAHLIVLARNNEGRREINRALSEANRTGFYEVPRLDLELIRTLTPENVFVTTACVAHWGKIDKKTGVFGMAPDAMRTFTAMLDHLGSSLYLEIQYHNTDWQIRVNTLCRDLSAKYHVPMIVGLDSHYVDLADKQERLLLREESGVKMQDGDHEFDNGVYEDYPDDNTVVERFMEQGVFTYDEILKAMNATDALLEFEDYGFDRTRKLPVAPRYQHLSQEERNELYRMKVLEGWERYRGSVPESEWPHYEQALEDEMAVVTSTNMSDYFLIDEALVREGVANGGVITPTGRGSCASFLSNTMLGFSTLDRMSLPVRMYPERFITADRLKTGMPDIDMNVADPEPFARAQEHVMGTGHSFPMIAWGTLKTKAAFKMYARAKKVDPQTANDVSAQITAYELALKHAEDDEDREAIDIADYVEPQFIPYIEESKAYQGIVTSVSQAPCGYLISNVDIESEIGLMRINANGGKSVMCAAVDGYTAEAFGYVKNDILTVMVIDINSKAMKKAGIDPLTSKQVIDLTANDRATWNIFSKGYTCGINQCQGTSTTDNLMVYKPQKLEDLAAFIAAIRPGFKSQLKMFLSRSKFSYDVPPFDDILKNDSSGSSFLLFQENSMQALNMAGFEMAETYKILKAISKKKPDVIKAAKDRFLDGFSKYIQKVVDGATVERADEQSQIVWKVIEDSSNYSFNACVSGRTVIADVGPVEELYDMLQNGGHISPLACSMYPDGKMGLNRIVNIYDSGEQDVYKVVVNGTANIYCTMNHKFPTPFGEFQLSQLNVGDQLFMHTARCHTLPVPARITSITYSCRERVYDVEMADPAHNYVVDGGIITSNSHAVAVALDALYGAYLKAHYTLPYYTALLENYAGKGNVDKVSEIKQEMKKAFDIRVAPCRFRQDNRTFTFDAERNTISDTLDSIKGVPSRSSVFLYDIRDEQFATFTDLLVRMQDSPAMDRATVKILILSGYFEEFGTVSKLLAVYDAFYEGPVKYSKNYVTATKEKRLAALRDIEKNAADGDIGAVERIRFEIRYFGAPYSVINTPETRCAYAVTDVNTHSRSPKLTLYSLGTGNTRSVKVKKSEMELRPLYVGDIIRPTTWKEKPAVRYKDGAYEPIPGVMETWFYDYAIL